MPENGQLELARMILRQGELRLQDQLTRAIASDQRSTTLAGILTAISVAVVGFGMTEFNNSGNMITPVVIGSIAAFIPLFLGIACCLRCAWPVKFAQVGANPENWFSDNVEIKSLIDCLHKESRNYSKRIAHNKYQHARATKAFKVAAWSVLASPVLGLIFWAVAVAE